MSFLRPVANCNPYMYYPDCNDKSCAIGQIFAGNTVLGRTFELYEGYQNSHLLFSFLCSVLFNIRKNIQ